jgi:hypothetical protein
MFVRITVHRLHQESRQQLGILHAVRYLNDDQKLTPSEFERADKVFRWLYSHLDAPSKKTLRDNPTAVSWFRIEAREHIKRIERLIPIVEAHGYVAKRRTCVSPGKIIYSDGVQAFAVRRPKTRLSGSRQPRDATSARIGRARRAAPEPARSATV